MRALFQLLNASFNNLAAAVTGSQPVYFVRVTLCVCVSGAAARGKKARGGFPRTRLSEATKLACHHEPVRRVYHLLR